MKLIEKGHGSQTTYFSLLLANLIPVYGVFFLDWSLVEIVMFYWVETFVIGIYNMVKILAAQGRPPKTEEEMAQRMGPLFERMQKQSKKTEKKPSYIPAQETGRLFLAIFFFIHYNFFIFVQFILLSALLGMDGLDIDPFSPLSSLRRIFINDAFLLPSILSVVISHAHSLYANYFKGGEYKRAHPMIQMFKPYIRIFIQQFVVIIGAFFVMLLQSPLPLLLLLVGFKIVVDLYGHYASHKGTYEAEAR